MEGNEMQFQVSDPAEQEIRRLRRENAKLRIQRNGLRDEIAELKAELGR
jgi:hypothetical protein